MSETFKIYLLAIIFIVFIFNPLNISFLIYTIRLFLKDKDSKADLDMKDVSAYENMCTNVAVSMVIFILAFFVVTAMYFK